MHVFCDNQTVVDHAQALFVTGEVDPSWMCQEWWQCLQTLTQTRRQEHPCPFQATWIPAHCFEHLPIDAITPAMATSRQTTVRNIERNRIADLTAKEYAASLSPVHPHMQHAADRGALQHQKWLAKLHELLPTTAPVHETSLPTPVTDCSFDSYQALFPQWPWGADIRSYKWKAKIPTAFLKPSEWDGSPGEWETVCAFLRNLRWNVKEDEITSICELTALFHFSAHKFDNRSPETTYLDYHRKLRRAIVLLSRSVLVQAVPGTISATLAKAAGRTMPQGSIVGAFPYVCDDALIHLARIFEGGAGRTLAS